VRTRCHSSPAAELPEPPALVFSRLQVPVLMNHSWRVQFHPCGRAKLFIVVYKQSEGHDALHGVEFQAHRAVAQKGPQLCSDETHKRLINHQQEFFLLVAMWRSACIRFLEG
jgi:hypothetical protein